MHDHNDDVETNGLLNGKEGVENANGEQKGSNTPHRPVSTTHNFMQDVMSSDFMRYVNMLPGHYTGTRQSIQQLMHSCLLLRLILYHFSHGDTYGKHVGTSTIACMDEKFWHECTMRLYYVTISHVLRGVCRCMAFDMDAIYRSKATLRSM